MRQNEKEVLITLAKQQLEISQSDNMKRLENEWRALNDCVPVRPMVTIELNTFANEVVSPQMQCVSDDARAVEWRLRCNTFNTIYFGDDTFVRDFYPVNYGYTFVPFGIDVKTQHTESGGIGHHFVEQINDLEEDFHKLGKSSWKFHAEEAQREFDFIGETIGHILPPKFTGYGQYCVLTQNLLHLMNTQTFMMSMYDYPELFTQMMQNLSNDYYEFYDELEKSIVLLSTTDSEYLGQGTYCFNSQLPKEPKSTKDIWCFFDSQESVGMSPNMFNTFIFPHYKKLMDRFGLVSYGCCEPADPFWDKSLSQISNLRKLSISPWCNEEFIAERLHNKNIVYHRKPSANFLGVGKDFADDELRSHISKTVKLNRGRSLEVTQRDVYTVHSDIDKVKRYVRIVREEFERCWS